MARDLVRLVGGVAVVWLLTAVPVATVYIVAQRLMVAGLTAGSLKG